MESKRKLTRRQFIQLSALAAAGAVVTACGSTEAPTPAATTDVPETEAPTKEVTEEPTEAATEAPTEEVTEEPTEEVTEEPASKYKEAPMLAALVASGDLPPVDERLPMNPYVCAVAESIGNYGGNIRRGFKGVSDRWGPTKHLDRSIIWFDQDLTIIPHWIEGWEVSDDAATWTFNLRKGMKWSDGTPLTSADYMWFYENVAKNSDLSPAPPSYYSTRGPDGNPVLCEMECPDDYTVVMKFAHPNPLCFYTGAARQINGYFHPGHYMKQFHIDLTDDKEALEAEYTEAGFNSWDEYYNDRIWYSSDPNRPHVIPWLAKNSLSEELFLMERNPYYMGVDPEGNQLPYIDTITHRLFESAEVFNMWVVNGEMDFHGRHVAIANYSLFKESEANGDYKVVVGVSSSHVAMQLNLATKNEKLREFFNNRDVRIAVSLAMNREEMNELVFDGLYTPRQYSPLSLSPNYYQKLSDAYIEYDPDQANELLDAAGYDQRDADGYRTYPDGETITFIIEGTSEPGTPDEDAVQLAVGYLNDVGIKATYKYFERSLYTEHYSANEIEAAWWGGDRTVLPLAISAIIFRGIQYDRPWAVGYGMWYNDPTDANAMEPPEDHFIRKIWDIWDNQVAREADPAKQNQLFEGILEVWAEELPMIGLLGEAPAIVIVKNGFRNYLPGMPLDDTTGDEHFLQTETYFWDDPENRTA